VFLSLTSSIERTKFDLSKLDSDRAYFRKIFFFPWISSLERR